MTISYPLTMPTSVSPVKVTRRLIRNQMKSTSPFTFKEQVAELQGDHWEYQIEYPPMTQSVAQEWVAFFARLHGIKGTFYLSNAGGNIINGNPSGTPVVVSVASDKQSVASSGWTVSTTGLLMPGDFISFSNGEYKMVTEQVDSDGTGLATINFEPAIRGTVSAASSITTTLAKGIFKLTSPDTETNIHDMLIYGLAFMCREAIT